MRSSLFKNELRKHWLVVGIIWVIFLAAAYPKLGSKEGPLKPEYTVKYGAVSLIFLISGLSIRRDSIYETFQQRNLHGFVQLFTFLFIPTFTGILVQVIGNFNVDPWILKGLMTVACMPPPVSSAVILTKAALGNETAAIFNSVLGSFLGIIITPLLLLFSLGVKTNVALLETIFQLSCTVLLPLMLGQCVKQYVPFRQHDLPLSTISQCTLLFIIYCTFCDAFQMPETGLSASDILVTVFLVILIKSLLLAISFSMAKSLNCFTPSDLVAILFCSTHKSLTLGIPILRIMFGGSSYFSKMSLPLLVYHPVQIILGGFLVSSLKDWVYARKNRKPPV